ncbi:MAG: hypothetical protein H8E21_09410 [Gammaproteobacteria bacterium]|nr:hypothetical protein [Gammaproteobacteria bacterium]
MRTVRHLTLLLLACSSISAFADNSDAIALTAQNEESLNVSEVEQMPVRQQKDLDNRISNIDALLNAYLNITSEAQQPDRIHAQVVAAKAQAAEHYQAQDYAAGRAILERTYAQLQTAIIQLRDGSTLVNSRGADEQYDIRSGAGKQNNERNKLMRSIDALLDAFQRVSIEKGQREQASIMQRNIATLRARADGYFQSADTRAGNELLNGAYTLIREALATLREGDTLIQSLDFATPQAEYQYYVEKTQSQQMAIGLLLEMSANSAKNAVLNSLLASVRQMLEQAAGLAAEDNYSAAIGLMDKAFSRLQSGLMMSIAVP